MIVCSVICCNDYTFSSPILSLIHHGACLFGWFGLVWFCLVSFVGLFVWYPPGALHFPVAGTGNRAVTPRRVAVRVLGVLSVGSAWQCMVKGYERMRAGWRLQRGYCRFLEGQG